MSPKFSIISASIPPEASASESVSTQSAMASNVSVFRGEPGSAGTCNIPMTGFAEAGNKVRTTLVQHGPVAPPGVHRRNRALYRVGLVCEDRS